MLNASSASSPWKEGKAAVFSRSAMQAGTDSYGFMNRKKAKQESKKCLDKRDFSPFSFTLDSRFLESLQ